MLEAAVLDHVLDSLVSSQGSEPSLSAGGRVQRYGAGRFCRLIEQSPRCALRMGNPYQRVPVDDCKPCKLATLARETNQERLADVGDAARHIEPLTKHRQSHRKPVEPGPRILLGPTEIDQSCKESLGAALRKGKAIRDFPQGHLARPVREELNDRETAFGGYVCHSSEP